MIKKIVFLISIVCNVLLIGMYVLRTNTPSTVPSSRCATIALFQPLSHPALDEIMKGFKDTLSSDGNVYNFVEYNAQADRTLLHNQAEEIIQNNYDLIFTVGAACSQTIHEIALKRKKTTPQVFAAVDNPEMLGLIDSNVTGVTETVNYRKQLELVKLLMPSLKRLLLVYDPSQGTGLEKNKQQVEHVADELDIQLIAVEIKSVHEIPSMIKGKISDVDAVMILKDNTVVSAIDSVVTLCQRYKKPLIASDLSSGEKGAVIAYGILEYDFGRTAAQQARLIVEDHKKPSEIPVSDVTKLIMNINKNQMSLQNLMLDPQLIELLSYVVIK